MSGASPADRGHRCTPPHAPTRPGRFDESARRVSWEELTVAQVLVCEGHLVRALSERPRRGPIADFEVCGVPTEVKTLDPGASARTLANALLRGRDQGDVVIVDASRSGLPRWSAGRGVALFAARQPLGRVEAVRVLGAGFDLRYDRGQLARLATARSPELGVGIA